MKKIIIIFLLCCPAMLLAQSKLTPINYVQMRNYGLLTLLQSDKAVSKMLSDDAALSALLKKRTNAIKEALSECKDANCIVESLKFNAVEINTVSERLRTLYQTDSALGKLVAKKIIPSGAYVIYGQIAPQALLVKAWEQDAVGINHTIDVYAAGKKPNYPAIDSISFNVYQNGYINNITQILNQTVAQTQNTKLFFQPSLKATMLIMDANGRTDAGSFEPMEKTVNRAAILKTKSILWAKYPYSLILVPGEGPEDTAAITPQGKLRCKLAASEYLKGAAPFIMVSGGKVHPFKTKYCEAEEMKKYLIEDLHIAANAIIMEPHARHTTTNLRNGVRLIYQYHFPVNKPAVVISDKSQTDYITKMAARCIKELGYVPYSLGKRLSDTEQEFSPVWEAMQINVLEPLDP